MEEQKRQRDNRTEEEAEKEKWMACSSMVAQQTVIVASGVRAQQGVEASYHLHNVIKGQTFDALGKFFIIFEKMFPLF